MRRLVLTLLTIALAVALALVIEHFPGNVWVVVDHWRLQMSLSLAILLLVALFVSVYVTIRLVVWLTALPTRYQGWRGQKAERREQSRMEQGWIALLEGRHAIAEKLLTRVSADAKGWKRQVLADLSAARAAQEIGAFDRRDQLIQKAQNLAIQDGKQSSMATAVAAAAADLWLDQRHHEAALEVLVRSGAHERKDVHTLRLLLRTHQQLNNNEQVLDLARRLSRQQAISTEQADSLIGTAAAHLIEAKSLATDSAQWETFWKSLRAQEKVLVSVALAGSDAYQARGKSKESSKVLEIAIKESFDPRLLQAYSKAESDQVKPRLQNAERWLSQRKNDPNLLLTLGALCLAAQMWGQAQRYLEQSAEQRSDSHVNALLGSLFDRLGQPDRAAQYWRKATAVSAALPTLAQDVFLPAADFQADPVFTVTEAFVDEPLARVDTSENGLPRADAVNSLAGSSLPGRVPQQDYDELFDSAPLPTHAFESADTHSNEKKQ